MKITNAFFEQNTTQESPLIKLCRCTELPPKISYWLSRLLQSFDPLLKVYTTEHQKLILKWCDKDESGKVKEENGQYKLSTYREEFNKEYVELLNIELELDIKEIEIPLDSIPKGVLNSFDYAKLNGIIVFKE